MAKSTSNAVKSFKDSFNWEVERHTPMTMNKAGVYVPEDDYVALKRSDNGTTLHLANATYTETKNSAFEDYAHRLSEASGYALEGFAEFRDGEKVLAYLKATDDMVQKHLGLPSENYLVFGNSHNGTTPIFVGSVNILLRCHNAWGRVMQGLKVRHTKNQDYRIEMFIDLVRGFREEKEKEALQLKRLSEIQIDQAILDSLANRLLNIDEKLLKENILPSSTGKRKADLMESFTRETNDLGMNLFGAFNGVTHFTTHKKFSTDAYGNILGGNQKITDDAFKLVNEYATLLA
jgi:hypothetical protein